MADIDPNVEAVQPEDLKEDESPEGQYTYWSQEFQAAQKFLQPFHESSEEVLRTYLDERSETREGWSMKDYHANYFWANITTQQALMYGQTPGVDVSRRYADPDDDIARVAGPIILKRLLDSDIERDEDNTSRVANNALADFLRLGYGFGRICYTAKFEKAEGEPDDPSAAASDIEPGYEQDAVDALQKTKLPGGGHDEDVSIAYTYWKDQLWSPSRVFEEMRWWAFRTPMSKEEITEHWGEKVAEDVPYKTRLFTVKDFAGPHDEGKDPWVRCEVWEIWDKATRKVHYYVKDYPRLLETADDPLKLRGFFPFPEPMFANLTTTKLLPKSDYVFAQDLYKDINELTTRIHLLETALRVAGLYNGSSKALVNLLTKTGENQMIPVEGWAMFAEKGGVKGNVDWFPLEMIANTLDKLREQRKESREILADITGTADLMRGQNDNQYEKAAAAVQRGRYGSVRIQQKSDQFARWFSGLQRLRAEAMINLFSPETILARANIRYVDGDDQSMAMAAIQLLKADFPNYRIKVTAESLAQQDFAAMQNERGQFVLAMSNLMREMVPAVQQLGPSVLPLMVETLKWTAASFRGAANLEAAFDRALKQAQQAAANPQQPGQQNPMSDPQVMKEMVKQQTIQMQAASKVQTAQQLAVIDVQADAAKQRAQTEENTREQTAIQHIKNQGEAQRQQQRLAAQAAMPAKPAPTTGEV